MKYTTFRPKANNTWHDDIEIWDTTSTNPISDLSIYEPEDQLVFTGLLDENGDYIYRDTSYRIGFNLNKDE